MLMVTENGQVCKHCGKTTDVTFQSVFNKTAMLCSSCLLAETKNSAYEIAISKSEEKIA